MFLLRHRRSSWSSSWSRIFLLCTGVVMIVIFISIVHELHNKASTTTKTKSRSTTSINTSRRSHQHEDHHDIYHLNRPHHSKKSNDVVGSSSNDDSSNSTLTGSTSTTTKTTKAKDKKGDDPLFPYLYSPSPKKVVERKEESAMTTTTTTTTTTLTKQVKMNVPVIDYNYTIPIQYKDYKTRFPLPLWLETMLSKHQPTSKHLETLSNPKHQFLIMTCHTYKDENNITQKEPCGGLSDRLMMLPYNLWLAHQTNRKLLIKYSRPAPLEEYLVPTSNIYDNFDWRLPNCFFDEEWKIYSNRTLDEMKQGRWQTFSPKTLLDPSKRYHTQRVIFLNNNLAMKEIIKRQNQLYQTFYNNVTQKDDELPDDTAVARVWPGIFRRMFQPSQGVANDIERVISSKRSDIGHDHMNPTTTTTTTTSNQDDEDNNKHSLITNNSHTTKSVRLEAGTYVSAHVRARYRMGIRGNKESIFYNVTFNTNQNESYKDETTGKQTILDVDKQNEGNGYNMNDLYTRDIITKLATNAVKCAILDEPSRNHQTTILRQHEQQQQLEQSQHDVLVYVASDSNDIIDVLSNLTKEEQGVETQNQNNHVFGSIETRRVHILSQRQQQSDQTSSPIHFDIQQPLEDPTLLYSTFVDLWIMSHAKCQSYGIGGYGLFASKLSGFYPNCTRQHRTKLQFLEHCPIPQKIIDES